jgi:hypothetical protein
VQRTGATRVKNKLEEQIVDPRFFRKYADLIEQASMAEDVPSANMQVDPQTTGKYAEEIVDKLNSYFSTTPGERGFYSKVNQDGSVTVIQGHPGTMDTQYADMEGVVSPQNVSKVIGPYYNMFRQKGWRFDQPVGGEFTVAVPAQSQ